MASLLMAIFAGSCFATRQADSQPNIVFLLIDDMGWPDVGCYGHRFHETPVIDQLAASGMRFTDFYAATPVCSSTRSTIQTGQYSARTGITDFLSGHWRRHAKLIVPPLEQNLRPGIRTPGHLLQQAGYTTGYFGKWHLGRTPDQQPDHWGYGVTEKQLGAEFHAWRGNKPAGPKKIDLLTDQTIYFIEQHRDKPFFVTLSHHAVHIPLEAEGDSISKYQKKHPPEAGINNPTYAAMTQDLDRSIGRLLQRLDELGLAQNTVVVFTSDNGGLRQTFTEVGDIVSTNAPLRDEKGSLYEGGIRVPMIVRWPGVVPGGTIHSEPTTTADLLPTFCEIANADLPQQTVDGVSLAPLLRGGKSLGRNALYFHYPHYHHSRPGGAIRRGPWKLIEFFDDGRRELYNLADDIGESRDLSREHPDRTEQLHAALVSWRENIGARMPTPNPEYAPDQAHTWWRRRTRTKINVDALRKAYENRHAKPGRKKAAP